MSTNRFAAALSVLVASVLVVVAVTPAQQTPIKIGFTTDLTGTAAQAAKARSRIFTKVTTLFLRGTILGPR